MTDPDPRLIEAQRAADDGNLDRAAEHVQAYRTQCLCEQLDWSTVTDEDRGEDGMNHHPQCTQGEPIR